MKKWFSEKTNKVKEVKECFDWLKTRIASADLTEEEKQQFDKWIAQRMKETGLDENEK